MSLRQLAVFACLLAAPATGFAQEKKAELSDADKALIKAVRDNGGQALQLAQNDARITVAFHLSDKEIGNDQLKPLANAKQVHSLNLRGTKITDDALQVVGTMTGLVTLHLEKTAITDAGLVHLKDLQSLDCLLYTSPSPRDLSTSRMPSSA